MNFGGVGLDAETYDSSNKIHGCEMTCCFSLSIVIEQIEYLDRRTLRTVGYLTIQKIGYIIITMTSSCRMIFCGERKIFAIKTVNRSKTAEEIIFVDW